MTLNDFLIEAHKALDAATVEDGLGNEALCMLNLGKLHGLILVFLSEAKSTGDNVCRECDCIDVNACPGGCHWVEPNLCSRCAHKS